LDTDPYILDKKKTYFASDLHLGIPSHSESLIREKLFVSWLDKARKDANAFFLLGDIFDFWFEYRRVVPRGYTRLLGKISELTDQGIPVHFFTGNHDIWVFDYLPRETGIILHRNSFQWESNGKKFYLSHGDGLGPGDRSYKILKTIFTNRTLQWLFARLHPNFALWLAAKLSEDSRLSGVSTDFLGEDKEYLIQYAYHILEKENFDYFIFGHRHIPLDFKLRNGSRFIFLGDWINHFTYGVFDEQGFSLKPFKDKI